MSRLIVVVYIYKNKPIQKITQIVSWKIEPIFHETICEQVFTSSSSAQQPIQ
jgi:hypothetical protein